MTLTGVPVLVVGGGSGIGFAVAQAAIAEGAVVTIASTNAEKLAGASRRLGGVETVQLDITDETAVSAFFESNRVYGHIVSTAGDWGKARRGPFETMNLEEARALFAVRFWGAATLAKYGAKRVQPGGSITLTSGTTAFRPHKGTAMATAMAGSIAHLTYGLAAELAPIRVNAVLPGGVATEIFHNLPDNVRQAEEARFERQLLPRIGQPHEIAEAYLYAMKGGYTTGQILIADGGGVLSS